MEIDTGISKARVETLTDGIYAIAMTLLVLAINVPVVPAGESAEAVLPGLMGGVVESVMACAIAFLILLGFWLAHERIFRRLVVLDRAFTNLVLLTLLGIVFVPFTTMFSTDYPGARIAVWSFALNLGAIGLVHAVQWLYLVRHPALLQEPIAPPEGRRGLARSFCTPAAALLAVLISVPAPRFASVAYLLIPALLFIADHMWSR